MHTEFGQPFTQLLTTSGTDPEPIRAFYDQLENVKWATESLFNSLSEPGQYSSPGTPMHEYSSRRVALSAESLRTNSQIAYIEGLQLLNELCVPTSSAAARIGALRLLEPRQMTMDRHALEEIKGKYVRELANVVAKKATLKQDGSRLLDEEANRLQAETNELLAIKEADLTTGDIVIEYDGKSITGMSDIVPTLSDTRVGEVLRIIYLRLDPKSGRFVRHSASIKGGSLGAGIMPI
ncbi:MAG: hypothetical protein ACT4QB_02340 [Gammaproteobacteria bacterium]